MVPWMERLLALMKAHWIISWNEGSVGTLQGVAVGKDEGVCDCAFYGSLPW